MHRISLRHFPAAFALLAAALLIPSAASGQTQTGETFVFTADTHVSWNGTSDIEGIYQTKANPLLVFNETLLNPAPPQSHDGCIVPGLFGATKDLCNQVLQIEKMNALPNNKWSAAPFMQAGHTRQLSSTGYISKPAAVLIGGDLTDCGGGVNDSWCNASNGGYFTSTNGDQMYAFQALYDNSFILPLNLNAMPFLPGLVNPNASIPLQFPIFPGFGNHDLQTSGSYVVDYMLAFLLHHAQSIHSFDPNSLSYSFDLGNVHVVNAGVYPGSGDDSQLDYNSSAMAWFENDLAQYASDGRPVIIYSHFGFDSYSLSGDWWLASNRIEGLNQLWGAIENYNVIGYFQGHNHNPTPWYPFAPTGALPYDIFLPGAGYYQDFSVAHVTGTSMDVMPTQNQTDFSPGVAVTFATPFTKQLVPAPQPVTNFNSAPPGNLHVSSVSAGGNTYLFGVNPLGFFTIDTVSSLGALTPVDSGYLTTSHSAPSAVAPYELNGQAHFAMLLDGDLVGYVFKNNKLAPDWTQKGILGSSAIVIMPFGPTGPRYLIVDNSAAANVIDIYRIGSSGAALEASLSASAFPSPILMPYHNSQATVGLIRFQPGAGSVEFDGLTFSNSGVTLKVFGAEIWPRSAINATAVPMANGSTQIFVTSTPCLQYSSDGTCAVPDYDSPYYIRTVLPDNSGTDISWRGLPANMSLPLENAEYVVHLGVSGGRYLIGAYYFNAGLFREFALTPGAARL